MVLIPSACIASLTRYSRSTGPSAARPSPAAGTVVGAYTLVEPIGEGGFAVVYLAEQVVPMRRRVALKLIKPGMDSKQVIARFEAERQALALMDHPGIAQVFDAGETEAGRPYFAMEYVPGVPITAFADAEQLTLRQRLTLFLQACDAIQHAHQKGVVHRDIKPSNIFLARTPDGRETPKLIDFGISKVLHHDDDEAGSMLDWFALLSHGQKKFATGGSDSHHAGVNEVGYPKTYVRMPTDHLIVETFSWCREQIFIFRFPIQSIVRAVNSEAFPVVDDHPIFAFPAENLRAFAGLVRDRFAFVGPCFQVAAFGVVDRFLVAFVVVPHSPKAIRHFHQAGVDNAVG